MHELCCINNHYPLGHRGGRVTLITAVSFVVPVLLHCQQISLLLKIEMLALRCWKSTLPLPKLEGGREWVNGQLTEVEVEIEIEVDCCEAESGCGKRL